MLLLDKTPWGLSWFEEGVILSTWVVSRLDFLALIFSGMSLIVMMHNALQSVHRKYS